MKSGINLLRTYSSNYLESEITMDGNLPRFAINTFLVNVPILYPMKH